MADTPEIAQIKHEAETYLSQGLHQEALAVYENFLANARNLHPALQIAVRESIRRIRSAPRHDDWNEAELITDIEITLIRKGWRAHATNEERLASARALVNMGLFKDGLKEYRRLLERKFITATVVRGVTLCLVKLVRPQHFTAVVDHFVGETFKRPRNRKALKLAIAKAIDSQLYPRHFAALCYHLSRVNLDLSEF
jgi:hypothetical protein